MPELPEVETVLRGLAPHLAQAVIARAEVRREGLRRPFPPRLAERLEGRRVLGLRRRSKYILADLEGGESLLLHLGMSGRVRIDPAPPDAGTGAAALAPGAFAYALPALERHDHVVLHTKAGARVVLNDARRFGSLDLIGTEGAEAHPLLAGLGPEPLGNGFHAAHLAARFAGRRTPVKTALLDQRIIAGLGNIYVCEALHMSGIDPRRPAGEVPAERLEALAAAVREVLEAAIEAGGSTLRDHRTTDGGLGYFQHSFRVYGREGAPCASPGCAGTVTRIAQGGRSTFHCAACQR